MKKILFLFFMGFGVNAIILSATRSYKAVDEFYVIICILYILYIAYEVYKMKRIDNTIRDYPKQLDLYFDNEFQKELTEWEKYKKHIFYIFIALIVLTLIQLLIYIKR